MFHARQLPSHAQPLAVISPNGLESEYFVHGPNRPNAFVYGSAPNRGLETVLRAWPDIRSRVPNASLAVYYGFSPAFVKWGRTRMDNFEEWKLSMETLLRQPGVEYHGMVDHRTLAQGYASAGFILYPTSFPETGCVTLMKAMAMGAIPITSRFKESTLPELTGPYDLGPRPLDPMEEISATGSWVAEWVDAIESASRSDTRGDLASHRAEMKVSSRKRFLWANVAQIWHSSFQS